MKRVGYFTITTIVLVLVITFCAVGTVKSISKESAASEEAYYQELEKNYIRQVRAYLEEEGFRNSGVTMTRVLTQEGKREYNVLIHNSRLNNLSDAEKEGLKAELKELYSGMEECGFYHEFLEMDL